MLRESKKFIALAALSLLFARGARAEPIIIDHTTLIDGTGRPPRQDELQFPYIATAAAAGAYSGEVRNVVWERRNVQSTLLYSRPVDRSNFWQTERAFPFFRGKYRKNDRTEAFRDKPAAIARAYSIG